MKIVLQKNSPLGLREQIKIQIRFLIESGALDPGQALPSARDLSALLRINRNTITQAYKELCSEGLLDIVVGSGTFVRKNLRLKPKASLDRVFAEAMAQARTAGFRTEEIVDHFLCRLLAVAAENGQKHVLVVDCNDEVIRYIGEKIEKAFGAKTKGILIQEIEDDPEAALAMVEGQDLVVCGFNHLEELNRALPDIAAKVEVVAVLLQVDAGVINALARLPEGICMGCICANQRSTETLYNSAYFSMGRQLKRILAGLDNSKELQRLVAECDVIFATHLIIERVRPLVKSHQRLIPVTITLDQSSLALIGEKLGR